MDYRSSVEATVRYADFFNFPLTSEEISFWLITPKKVSSEKIEPFLPPKLAKHNRRLRSNLTYATQTKINLSRNLIKKLKYLPGLRMVALTGSVAANNSHPSDDIDLFFITSPHTLWLVRPLVLLVISMYFRRRHPGEDHSKATNAFCPNLWLDTTSLAVPKTKQNLYTAHEVLQIVPLLDRGGVYQSFLYRNRWVKKYLANAYAHLAQKTPVIESVRRSGIEAWQSVFFRIFYIPINYLFYLIQLLYMAPKKTTEIVHLHAAFLHTTDFATKISRYLEGHKV